MPTVRPALEGDLDSLLQLFACAEVSAHAQPIERARAIWAETIASDATDVFVAVEGERVAATCMLITVPNLLRGGRRLGVLENVVSHPDFRRGGYGRAVVEAALQAAWDKDCFHVLMQSGREDPAVHQFYKDRGFLPGLRTAYVVHNPALGDVDALLAVRPPGR
jgi:GNAT superfamily N-acetyltransferase